MPSPAIPILDLYVLSLLDRGLSSFYDLQKIGGLSVGASTPALKRLVKKKFVAKADDQPAGRRVRFRFEATRSGQKALHAELNSWLAADSAPADFDALLRLVDMATHYGHKRTEVSELCLRAAQRREQEAVVARHASMTRRVENEPNYPYLRALCDVKTLTAQASALRAISAELLPVQTPAVKLKARKRTGAAQRGSLPR